ncbi:MAG: hypothetical protein R6V11_03675 [Ectothiorhodospiraceae bacterium]
MTEARGPGSVAAWPDLGRTERWLLRHYGAAAGWHRQVHRLIPVLFAFSALVWLFAPAGWMAAMTPWVGAVALAGAGVYLARVIIVTGRATLDLAAWQGTADRAAIRHLRRALLEALAMAAATVALGLAFLVLGLQIAADVADPRGFATLWALCLGGFFLSLFVGELFMRLVDELPNPDAPALTAPGTGAGPERHATEEA